MKRREFKRQIKRIKALNCKWLGPLGLLWWHIDTNYYDSSAEFHAATGVTSVMSVCVEWRYAHATISVNVPVIAGLDDERLEFNYLHELAHIFLAELTEVDKPSSEHEEHAATVLAKAFVWLRKACEAPQ